jgi:CheY-like chemotaxis protein
MRILIIEDQTDHRELIALLLARKGYAIRSASSVDEGIDSVQAQPFDVILLDVMMPGRDGYSFLEEIRALPLAKRPRIIALTALGMREDRDKLLAAGCERVVTKPISTDELRLILESPEKERQ